jgi:hypothetical protein
MCSKCYRCGACFIKDYLIAHLKRKHLCAPKIKDVEPDVQLATLIKHPKQAYQCLLCKKWFSTLKSKQRHAVMGAKLLSHQQHWMLARVGNAKMEFCSQP